MSRGVKDLRELIEETRVNECTGRNGLNNTGEFEKCYHLLDNEVLSDMLDRSNRDLDWLHIWSRNDIVRFHFMNWWLCGLSESDRIALLTFEYEAVCAEVVIIIKSGCGNDAKAERATIHLLSMVFWEYPKELLSKSTSPTLFLDYLDLLLTRRGKHLLSELRITKKDSRTVQYCLTTRAFTICSIWTALVRFHGRLVSTGALSLPSKQIPSSDIKDDVLSQLHFIISHCFVAVLNYWIQIKKVDLLTFRDLEGRTLIILAVSFKSHPVLQFLVDNFDISGIIDIVSKTGNSALHVAVCQGSLDMVKTLVVKGGANVNVLNHDCDDCTSLDMALLYDHEDISNFLLQHGATSGSEIIGKEGDPGHSNTPSMETIS